MPNTSILALHGFTGGGEDFKGFSPLCHSIDTWHCPNLPGHGSKPQLDCTPEANLAFIKAQLSTLSAPPSVLLGYSMGARVALQHAVAYPDFWDAIILISPNPGIEVDSDRSKRRSVDEKLARRIEQHGAPAFIEFWQNTPMIRSQKNIRSDWREAMQAVRQGHTAEGLAASLREFGQGSCPNLWPSLHQLKMPILLLTGAEDLKYTAIAQGMVAALAAAPATQPTSICIDGVSHMPHLEAPEACAATINSFLANR